MKFNVLRRLLIPWVILFISIISAVVFAAAKFQQVLPKHPAFLSLILVGVFLCLIDNIRTTTKAGIWISQSLPEFLRRQTFKGFFLRIMGIVALAGLFYQIGTLAFAPLYWNGFIVPAVFTICLIASTYVLVAPILSWCSMIAFTRFFTILLTLPIFLVFPVVAFYLSQFVLSAYLASRPQPLPLTSALKPAATSLKTTTANQVTSINEPQSELAKKLKTYSETPAKCAEQSREIQAALDPLHSDEVVYWALKCVKHAQIKPVIGLTKLVDLFMKSKNSLVRANAISAMICFPQSQVKELAYLLYKRMNDQEAPEVIQASASTLAKLGETEQRLALKKLKGLMTNPRLTKFVAETLIQISHDDLLVTDFILQEMNAPSASFSVALDMICLLSESSRSRLKPNLPAVLSAIKNETTSEPAMRALACFESDGLAVVQNEVNKPTILKKDLAAKALASLPIKNSTSALKIMADCVNDKDESVRQWCSQGLGRIGVNALPKIVDLLGSTNKEKFKAGEKALLSFADVKAKQELLKLRAEHSGWTASQKKLRVSKAIDSALINLSESTTQ